MTIMTFRAPDSMTAMELIQNRFGDDAYILSVSSVEGGVEVVATDDAPAPRAVAPAAETPPVPQAAPRRALVDILIGDAETSGAAPGDHVAAVASAPLHQGTGARPDAAASGPQADMHAEAPEDMSGKARAAATDAPKDAPLAAAPARKVRRPSATVTKLPRFLDPAAPKPFAEMLLHAKRAKPARSGPAAAPPLRPARPTAAALRAEMMGAGRIVLAGPVGGGKCQAALQLALMRIAEAPGTEVTFYFCGSGSHSDGAFLAQKSHVLGMRTEFETVTGLPRPQAGNVQIVVISGRGGARSDAARAALQAPGTRGALVAPIGASTAWFQQMAADWALLGHGVILSGDARRGAEFACRDAVAASLDVLWLSSDERLIDGLSRGPARATDVPDVPAALEPAGATPASEPNPPALIFRHQPMTGEAR